MTTTTSARPTLIDHLWLARDRSAVRMAILALLGSGFLWASAKAQVPMWPVPMTMQSYVVLVIGMAYGARLAAATVALYLVEGVLGLPVFAGTPERGIGLAYMMGPTGGYLVGFLIAAWAMGWLAERGWDRRLWRAVVAMSLGTVLLFVPGVAWLGHLIGWEKAVGLGLTPFIVGSVLKLALAAATLPLAWRLAQRQSG